MALTIAYTGILMSGNTLVPVTPASAVLDATLSEVIVQGIITFSGNYGVANGHGDILDFTSVAPPESFGSVAPSHVEVFEMPQAGVAPTGYDFVYCPGPTLAAPTQQGGKLAIMATGAASGQGGTELTNGSAYSTFTPSLNGVIIGFKAWFAKGQ